MSLSLQNKGFIKTAVAVSVALSATQFAQANNDAEIQQLRAEVQQLRELVQQKSGSSSASGVTVSTKSGTDVKFYGNVRVDAGYVIKGADDQFQDPMSTTEEVKNQYRITPNISRLGFDFATPVGNEKVTGKIETDFLPGNLRIRHAYFKYGNWTVGQTDSLFSSDNVPNIIDFNGAVGDRDYGRNPQIRYTFNAAEGTKVEVAAERGQRASGATFRTPAISAKLTQAYGDKGSASISAIATPYKVDTVSKNVVGFGVGAGANYEFVDGLSVMGDLTYGRGLNSTYGARGAYNTSGNEVNKNEYASFVGGVNYKISPQISTSLGYGLIKFKDDGSYARAVPATAATSAVANRQIHQAWANVMYSPVKAIDLGAEYIHAQRKVFNGTKFDDSRVNLMARYKF